MASPDSGGNGRSGGARAGWSAAAGLALGLAAGALLWGGPSDSPQRLDERAESASSNAVSHDATERERLERVALETEVEELRAALAEATGEGEPPAREPEPTDLYEGAGEEADETEAGGAFDVAALEAAGFSAAEIERLRERYESYELDRLYLDNLARREGWVNRPRFLQERRELRAGLRESVSDDDYDAMLYAAGRNNRVIVAEVLPNSAAEAAGLRRGDALIRYDDARIFDPFSLVRATADGEAGASTELRVLRGGEEIRLFLPRGPIGVRLARKRRAPNDPR